MVEAKRLESTSRMGLLKKPWGIVAMVSVALILFISAINQKSTEPSAVFIYDIPALIGKNIDQADKELGTTLGSAPEPPSNQSEPGGTKWHRIYMQDQQALIVNFNSFTREVISFVLEGDNKEELLTAGHLSEHDSRYKIEKLSDVIGMVGIRITPQ